MKRYLGSMFAVFLCACSPIDVTDYASNKPELNVEEFFSGELIASGIVKNRRGKVLRSFTANITAQWQNNVGTLDESFVFSDGEQQERIWTLKKQEEKLYAASANDVVGTSTMRVSGNALFLKYTLTIQYKGKPMNIRVDDRMYLVSPDTLINESIMTKYGFEVGYVTLTIRKLN